MDGWQLPLAPEQGFSLALAQERVGVMRFATPSAAMTMNFVPVVTGAAGGKGDKGDAGVGALTSGAGIVIVGTEVRLSIGTLPQVE